MAWEPRGNLRGPQGPQGLRGPQGLQGPKGDPGDPATNLITSVFGRTGAVVAQNGDYSVGQVTGAVPNTLTLTAGNGLTGGGNLTTGRAFQLGVPGSITASSVNAVQATSHTHELNTADSYTWTGQHRHDARVEVLSSSVPWGSPPGQGLRAIMGTSVGATWLIHGYSGAEFRGGIQLLDSGTMMRLYLGNGNYATLNYGGTWNGHASDAVSVNAGSGLTGGGTIASTRTISLGTPGTISGSTSNQVTTSSHTHALSSNLSAWDNVTPSSKADANSTLTLGKGGPSVPSFNDSSNQNDWTGTFAAYANTSILNKAPMGNSNVLGFGLGGYAVHIAARNDRIAFRTQENSNWQEWREFFHSGNQLNIGTSASSARNALDVQPTTDPSFTNAVSTSWGIYASSDVNSIRLRPNGPTTTAGQLTLDSSGNLHVGSQLHVNGARLYLNGSGDGHIVGTGSGGITLRPNGWSTSGQVYLEANGTLNTNGDINSSGDVYARGNLFRRRADNSAWEAQPRHFIQSANPGARASENDLWGW